ncbi:MULTISPECIES: ABC transporter substrate-binding protein, partial [unclassified Arthrobacter]|uniref:ABC transporter substrate-binding protein n=1 Tax=unclassified Arthrobacter TaxID=235627 RepID=UPI0011B03F13
YTVPGSETFEEVVINSGDFTRTHNAVYTFGYNSQLVKDEDAPKSWADFVDPKWAGKIGVVQGNSGGGVAALNRFMETELGEDYMSKYAALKPVIYEGSGPQQTALARGEIAVGTVGSATVNIAVKTENAPLSFVVPEEGLISFDYYLGATAKGSNPEAADIFMNYNMSKRGQQIFADLGDYAVNPEIAPPTAVGVKLPAVDSGKVWRMSVEDAKHGDADATKWKTVFAY